MKPVLLDLCSALYDKQFDTSFDGLNVPSSVARWQYVLLYKYRYR
jgi:hypothetical protein